MIGQLLLSDAFDRADMRQHVELRVAQPEAAQLIGVGALEFF